MEGEGRRMEVEDGGWTEQYTYLWGTEAGVWRRMEGEAERDGGGWSFEGGRPVKNEGGRRSSAQDWIHSAQI